MKIDNPFESGQIKNYLLFYSGVVVIMILFFIASSLFNDIKEEKPKVFDTNITVKKTQISSEVNTTKEKKSSIGLMKKDIY
jgi:phosphotransferase system  glucose/maltose/N-acetylglucosamine-specific IIC component